MELEITMKRTIRVWWSYFWKMLACEFVFIGLGILICIPLEYMLGLINSPVLLNVFIILSFFLLIIVMAAIVPMRLTLGKDFGEFRLVLQDAKAPE